VVHIGLSTGSGAARSDCAHEVDCGTDAGSNG
jgi:hypothetical protein